MSLLDHAKENKAVYLTTVAVVAVLGGTIGRLVVSMPILIAASKMAAFGVGNMQDDISMFFLVLPVSFLVLAQALYLLA